MALVGPRYRAVKKKLPTPIKIPIGADVEKLRGTRSELQWALSKRSPGNLGLSGDLCYGIRGNFATVCLINNTLIFILADIGNVPASKVQHKRWVLKIIFMTLVGRLHDRWNGAYYDKLVGCWPLVKQTFAYRASKNQEL